MDRDQREYHQDVGSTWLVSCRNSPTPARDIAFALHAAAATCRHGGSRWARRSVASRAGRPPKVRPKACESSGWQMVLWPAAARRWRQLDPQPPHKVLLLQTSIFADVAADESFNNSRFQQFANMPNSSVPPHRLATVRFRAVGDSLRA